MQNGKLPVADKFIDVKVDPFKQRTDVQLIKEIKTNFNQTSLVFKLHYLVSEGGNIIRINLDSYLRRDIKRESDRLTFTDSVDFREMIIVADGVPIKPSISSFSHHSLDVKFQGNDALYKGGGRQNFSIEETLEICKAEKCAVRLYSASTYYDVDEKAVALLIDGLRVLLNRCVDSSMFRETVDPVYRRQIEKEALRAKRAADKEAKANLRAAAIAKREERKKAGGWTLGKILKWFFIIFFLVPLALLIIGPFLQAIIG